MDVLHSKPGDNNTDGVPAVKEPNNKTSPQKDIHIGSKALGDVSKSNETRHEMPREGAVDKPGESRNIKVQSWNISKQSKNSQDLSGNQSQKLNMSEYSTLKSLLQAPTAQPVSLQQAPMSLKSRWRNEVKRSREHNERPREREERAREHDERPKECEERSREHDERPREREESSREHDERPRELDERSIDHNAVTVTNTHDKANRHRKPTKEDSVDKAATSEIQLYPLDLSCKNPMPTRASSMPEGAGHLKLQMLEQSKNAVHNGQSSNTCALQDEGLQQALQILDQTSDQGIPNGQSPPPPGRGGHNLQPVLEPESVSSAAPAKEEAAFDPLFILSQVACEKLSELKSTQPDTISPAYKSKKGKKGMTKKSKKKDKFHSKDFSQDSLSSREVMENKKLYDAKPALGFNTSQDGIHNVYEPNGYHDNQSTQGLIPPTCKQATSVPPQQSTQGSSHADTHMSSPDYYEISQMKKLGVNVDRKPQPTEGDSGKPPWPFTCRTCNTRFKNAAFLRIHEKIAHENKMARTDRSGDHISFVSKDGPGHQSKGYRDRASLETRYAQAGGPQRTDGDSKSGGFTSIPCVLKVNRQTSTSEMSSSVVKVDDGQDGSAQDSKARRKYESLNDGRPHIELIDSRRVTKKSMGDKTSHQRPKLEVDGSAYEIIKVEQEKPQQSSPSTTGYQHKFYLQISDRNQSGEGVDSMVKIEREHSMEEDCDVTEGMSGLKSKFLDGGNPNQIRVPTSLALKFIPGESTGDSAQRQPGYQHKVYLRIVDGADSSIRIKTGSSHQSPNMVGSTAVKIESTYNMSDASRYHLNDASRPHKCHFCPKHFPSISALTAHERIHTGEKPYECRFCGRAFYHQNDRRKHERIHTGEKPYQCSICGQKFTNKGQVKIHERNHTGERPYQCRHCHKCFKSISNVNRHEKIHTGLKPYTCPVCSRGFSRREHVRTHEEICRKKMLEEGGDELADDSMGDAKQLPYYRKIAMRPADGDRDDGLNPDESSQKRLCYDDYYARREQWSGDGRRTEGFMKQQLDDRYSSDDDVDDDEEEDRLSTEEYSPTASVSSSYDKISPSLYNSGPPIKPLSSNPGVIDGGRVTMVSQDAGPSSQPSLGIAPSGERRQHIVENDTNSSTSLAEPVKAEDVARITPLRPPDHHHQSMRDASHKTMPNLSNPKPNVGRLGRWLQSNSESCSPIHNEMPPLKFVGSAKVSKPGLSDAHKDKGVTGNGKKRGRPPVSKPLPTKDKPGSDKLSAHIEALLPLPHERVMQSKSADIIAKKEPRFYVCGAPQTRPIMIQQEMGTFEANSNPIASSTELPKENRNSVAYYSNSQREYAIEKYAIENAIDNSRQLPQLAGISENSQMRPYAERPDRKMAISSDPYRSGVRENLQGTPYVEKSVTSEGSREMAVSSDTQRTGDRENSQMRPYAERPITSEADREFAISSDTTRTGVTENSQMRPYAERPIKSEADRELAISRDTQRTGVPENSQMRPYAERPIKSEADRELAISRDTQRTGVPENSQMRPYAERPISSKADRELAISSDTQHTGVREKSETRQYGEKATASEADRKMVIPNDPFRTGARDNLQMRSYAEKPITSEADRKMVAHIDTRGTGVAENSQMRLYTEKPNTSEADRKMAISSDPYRTGVKENSQMRLYAEKPTASEPDREMAVHNNTQRTEVGEKLQTRPYAEKSSASESDGTMALSGDTHGLQQVTGTHDGTHSQTRMQYSDSQRETKPTITSTPSCGHESPPMLYLASAADESVTKEESEKTALDEPPKLSGPHMDEGPPNIVSSAIPPLLERTVTQPNVTSNE